MKHKLEIERFNEVAKILKERFPALLISDERRDTELDAELNISKQVGLDFDVNINLQNFDELHLSIGSFWVEWFPCGEQAVFDRFVEATLGFISGSYRIVERRIGSRVVSATLERPISNGWEVVTGCSNLNELIPWLRKIRVLQNKSAG